MRAGSGALETWSDDPRYAFSFLHGFARERPTGCSRWPNRPRPEVGGGRRSEKRGGQTKALNSRIDLGDCFVRRSFLLNHQAASGTLNWRGLPRILVQSRFFTGTTPTDLHGSGEIG